MVEQNEFQKENTPSTIITHFGKFEGIRNTVPRTDLKTTDLWDCVNFDINRDGMLFRRQGFTPLLSGTWPSIWSDGVVCFGIQDGNLVQVMNDFSISIIRYGVGNNRMSFTSHDEIVYYTNELVIGYIKDGQDYAFVAPDRKYKTIPLPGQSITYYMGSLYICKGNDVWVTEPFRFNEVDMRYGIVSFPDKITMFAPVEGKPSPYQRSLHSHGIWVTTYNHLYYLSGQSLDKMVVRDVAPVGNLTGAFAYVDGQLFKDNQEGGQVVVFPTDNGLYWATNGGIYGNLTNTKFIMPQGSNGAAYFKSNGEFNQVILTVN